jgi:hypothetical protein
VGGRGDVILSSGSLLNRDITINHSDSPPAGRTGAVSDERIWAAALRQRGFLALKNARHCQVVGSSQRSVLSYQRPINISLRR